MPLRFPNLRAVAVVSSAFFLLSLASCGKKHALAPSGTDSSAEDTSSISEVEVDPAQSFTGPNAEMEELMAFRQRTRSFYNNREFAKLERLATLLHEKKPRFRDGDWKIRHYYESMDCQKDEPESMWKLHAEIHKDWEAKFPKSPTAKIATAEFLITYAWHARSDNFADKVTDKGWKLFEERLAAARRSLDEAKAIDRTCPMLWFCYQTVALGQGWKNSEYTQLFNDAKTCEPEFYPHDLARAKFLLPRWHGKPGEWETAAEQQIAKQGKTGLEIYARVVKEQATYYDNVFAETRISWPDKVQKGFDALRASHPDSNSILNGYCRLACFAGDKPTAKKLFADIGDNPVRSEWRKGEFAKAKQWAFAVE